MVKPLLPFGIGFLLIVAAAWWLGGMDSITPAVVEARAEVETGPVMMSVVNDGLVFMMKLIGGATVAGLIGAGIVEGRKLYRMWWREKRFRRGAVPSPSMDVRSRLPKLSREDLILMAMAQGNGLRQGRSMSSTILPLQREEGQGNEKIDIDF